MGSEPWSWRDQGYAATSWTEVLRTRRPSPEMHVGARAHAAGVVMGTASLCIRALKLQQLYTHYQQHCTRDEVPHTHTRQPRSQGCVIRQTRLSDLTFALSGGSHAPRRHTSTHTHNSQADAPAPSDTCSLLSSPPPKHPHTHTHGTHASRRAEKLTRCSRNHGARAPMRPPLSRAPRSSGPPYCSLPAPQDRGPSGPASPSRRARRRGRPRTLSRA